MITQARHRVSRGYLIAQAGALVGMIPGLLFPVAAVSSETTCTGFLPFCGFADIAIAAAVVVAMFAAWTVGIPLGVYAALRFAKRELASLTAWLVAALLVGVVVLGILLAYVPAVSGAIVLLPVGAVFLSPTIARRLAFDVADRLRKYQ